jgi:hypothetical protein
MAMALGAVALLVAVTLVALEGREVVVLGTISERGQMRGTPVQNGNGLRRRE